MLKLNLKTALIASLISCSVSFATSYHQPNIFPIGFSGLGDTGYGSGGNSDLSPYPEDSTYGTWAWEDSLLRRTGCNFIGCSDGSKTMHIRLQPDTGYAHHGKDFYNQVCVNAGIYLAPMNAYCPIYRDYNANDTIDTLTGPDTVYDRCGNAIVIDSGKTLKEHSKPRNERWATIFRSYWPCGASGDGEPDAFWYKMADSAATCYDRYFDFTGVEDSLFWGYNCFIEDPAMYVAGRPGIVEADNRITDSIRAREETGSGGLTGSYRMIIAKGQPYKWMAGSGVGEINAFEKVPEIDAVLKYSYMTRPFMSYGSQVYFDTLLYGYFTYGSSGFHNVAIYMQKFGKTPPLRNGQKRRWMAGVEINWEFIWRKTLHNNMTEEKVLSRRPCPPEIRCASYLALSRGAKGLLFINYYNHKNRSYVRTYIENGDTITETTTHPNKFPTDADMDILDPSQGDYPYSHASRTGTLGLRDYTSQPCDENYSGGTPVLLDVPDGKTTYWDGKPDHTFGYICELIPEIKKITPTLMKLDWINAYSLNSTAPEWRNPCPHYYVDDVWGAEFMELAFFDHPYEPVGVEYFMLVNREGIADMTNRTVSVALDAEHWPEEDSLILTDIANAENPRMLKRVGERFTFTEVFEPGEGKLYRVAPTNEAPITLVPSTEGGVR